MLEFESYVDYDDWIVKPNVVLPNKVKTITIKHDNGRCFVSINGDDFYTNFVAGSDYSVTIDNQIGE